MKRNLILFALLVILTGVVVGVYMYNKPHRNIVDEKASYTLNANEIYSEFITDEMSATQKYSEQVIAFEGEVVSIKENQNGNYYLLIKGEEGMINCELDSNEPGDIANIEEGETVTIKGLFIGYDGLLSEIQFKKCSLVN